MTPIKIETLLIRNFKRIELADVEVGPDGVTIIGGANRQGKSTFLDAVKFALGGSKYMPSNPHNANAGGATATVRITLSNGIEVVRSGKNSSLKIIVDGKKGNQATLSGFLNEFALDIDKFMRGSETEKGKMLIQHLGIGPELEHLDQKIKRCFDERTLVGRDLKRKEELAAACIIYENAPDSRVDLMELMRQINAKEAENRDHARKLEKMKEMLERGKAIRAQIKEMEEALNALKEQHDSLKAKVDGFTPHDLTDLNRQLSEADSLNQMYEANIKAAKAEAEAKITKKEHQTLTDTIEEARQQREALLSKMRLPLPDLTVVDGCLLYQGNAWDCMSGSERLKVATAISRAFKPECGFVLVDELEQMDWQTIKDFDGWARSEGIQILGAMVCDDDKANEGVIIISDGKVVTHG